MRKQASFVVLLFVSLAWSAFAILPPDAEFREPEIRAQRTRARKEYQKGLEERRAFMIREHMRIKAVARIPPWDRDRDSKRVQQTREGGENLIKPEAENGKKRVLVSIMLLILIGSGVLWAKRATREVD